jgi:hypothetical protein
MVSNKERARRAIDAMTALGFSKKESTPVLRSLLKLFDNSWEPIEDECYRALADAVLDNRERLKVSVLPKWKRQKVFFLGIIMGSKMSQKDPLLFTTTLFLPDFNCLLMLHHLLLLRRRSRSLVATVQEWLRRRKITTSLLLPLSSMAIPATWIVR